jgi:PD-(D/E)XK nuclease superfamily protein
MKIENKLGLPPAFERALHAHQHDRGGAEITVSELIGPPRIRMLRKRYPEQISADVSDMLWLLFGTAVHEHLAKHATNALTEERLGMDVTTALGTWRVSGAFDSLSLDSDGSLDDYKTTSVWKVLKGDLDDWTAQLNLYQHLAEHHGHEVRQLRIIALCRDWARRDMLRTAHYPKSPAVVIPIESWSDSWRQSYLEDRLLIHQQAEKELPLCTNAERWERKGKFIRCADYCDAVTPCKQQGDAQWQTT